MWEGQKGLEFMKFMKDRTCKFLDRPGILDSFCLGRTKNEVHTVKKHVYFRRFAFGHVILEVNLLCR